MNLFQAQEKNEAWSKAIIQKFDPEFRHRWEAFNSLITSLMKPDDVWIDLGCGNNSVVESFGHLVHTAIGVDALAPAEPTEAKFIQADINDLPFDFSSVDLVTLRFVVEHIENIPQTFSEIARILKPGGRVVVLTTNLWSPMIAITRFVPFRFKTALIQKIFNVRDEDVFPTFHRLNSPLSMHRGAGMLPLERIEYIQDANYVRQFIFLLLFGLHLATRPRRLQKFRANILAVFRKAE